MRTFLAALLLAGCTAPSDDADVKDTSDVESDTDTDTDTDSDPDEDRDGDSYPASTDCDETRPDVNPGVALDVCNDRDDNCDGTVDEDPDLSWYPDADEDGFGDPASSAVVTCDPGSGAFATNASDCDDTNSDTFPAADERCDGLDNDCDGEVDNGSALTTWYPDADGDGYGQAGSVGTLTCDPGAGSFASNDSDCNDTTAAVSPDAVERCDDLDNDCNGSIDENEAEWTAFYEDRDGDGAGTTSLVYGCDAASAGGATNDWDCDDSDSAEPVFVDTSGESRGPGTVARPYSSIQTAIYQANTCVRVAAGTYYEELDFAGRDIDVASLDGSGSTFVQGIGNTSVVTFQSGETAAALLQGFTLSGGAGHFSSTSSSYVSGSVYYYYYDYTYAGGGVYIYRSAPTLVDVVITDNVLPAATNTTVDYGSTVYYYTDTSSGGGLYVEYGSVALEDVTIQGNYSYSGGAIQSLYGDVTGVRVDISGNNSPYPTVWSESGSMILDNVIFNANQSEQGYGMFYTTGGGKLELRNSVLLSGNYGIFNGGSDVMLSSSIVSGNDIGIYDASGGGYTWVLTYNDVYGNDLDWQAVADPTGTEGNLYVNPRFTNWIDDTDYASDDLTLGSRSILVDAGDPDAARNDVDGSRNDMGAHGGPSGAW